MDKSSEREGSHTDDCSTYINNTVEQPNMNTESHHIIDSTVHA